MERREKIRASAAGRRESAVVPVLEEKLVVGKRAVETGAVQVRKRVRERVERVDVPLLRETVDVKRIPINKEVREMPRVRETADEIIIPVVEEEVIVTKRLILKEEVRLTRRRTSTRERQDVTLRSEDAEVVRVKRARRK